MLTVNEVSKLTGVSVRSLHHYDAIGLLKPAKVTDAGYRLYGDDELARLQNILLFRELQFPLKQIRTILDSPDFDLLVIHRRGRRKLRLLHPDLQNAVLQNTKPAREDADPFGIQHLYPHAASEPGRGGGPLLEKRFEDRHDASLLVSGSAPGAESPPSPPG